MTKRLVRVVLLLAPLLVFPVGAELSGSSPPVNGGWTSVRAALERCSSCGSGDPRGLKPTLLPPAAGHYQLAYIGPGAGFAFLGSFLTILAGFFLSFVSLLSW